MGLTVEWKPELSCLCFSNGLFVELNEVEWFDHRLPLLTYNENIQRNQNLIGNRLSQDEWKLGFEMTVENKHRMIQFLMGSDLQGQEILMEEEWRALIKLIKGEEGQQASEVFDYWMGRGLGLTPSGDDVLTGISAAIMAWSKRDSAFVKKLSQYVLEKGKKRTTHVAYEYLRYAAEGKFHSKLKNLCLEIGKPYSERLWIALDEMKKIGHTSGADTLLGVLVGMVAISEMEVSKG